MALSRNTVQFNNDTFDVEVRNRTSFLEECIMNDIPVSGVHIEYDEYRKTLTKILQKEVCLDIQQSLLRGRDNQITIKPQKSVRISRK